MIRGRDEKACRSKDAEADDVDDAGDDDTMIDDE